MNALATSPYPDTADDAIDDERWALVCARDRSADGRFVYAVSSTGIFCRPSCPSRRPRRERVRFFDSTGAAQDAGFRACLRCRPLEAADHWVASNVRASTSPCRDMPRLAAAGAAVPPSVSSASSASRPRVAETGASRRGTTAPRAL
jgi:AraC family transcriptional regulator of adaptative response/methylated-DNA-[protein]-cysteine methyltransferase